MRKRDGRLAQEAQRNPAGGELLLGAIVFVVWCRRLAGQRISQFEVAEVEQFARDEPPLDPPLIDVVQLRGIARRGCHQATGLVDFVAAAQPLNAAEDVTGVALAGCRHRFQQRLGVALFVDNSGARLGDRQLHGVEVMRGAQSGVIVLGIEPRVHADLVVGRRDQAGEGITGLLLRYPTRRHRRARIR